MPSAPRPKPFYALRDFRVYGHTYKVGDPVAGLDLQAVLNLDGYVSSAKAQPPAADGDKE